jgi:hypothetical protein
LIDPIAIGWIDRQDCRVRCLGRLMERLTAQA